MRIIQKAKRAFRGDIAPHLLFLEATRQVLATVRGWHERSRLEKLETPSLILSEQFAAISTTELLNHFQSRISPRFLPGFQAPRETGTIQRGLFPEVTKQLLKKATCIADDHSWDLMGFGEKHFGSEGITWRRDPLSGVYWPLEYHTETQLVRHDGSDVRVLWELNRLGHLLTLGRAYALTDDAPYAAEFFTQCESWRKQNPVGRGANWACAMEVALRAVNLLAAFELFRRSPLLNEERLMVLLEMFDSHGAHIRRNLEFSYIATSNHYLSDVVGLLWLGLMLPELQRAREWRDFGLREMLREMDKQILEDGADYEASTGYHRFVLELLLYSFILCRANEVEIEGRYWLKLSAMLEYVRAYLRPDGQAPLIGDSDSGRVLPISRRAADDHAYLLALGAVLFNESRFKHPQWTMPEELLWFLGAQGVCDYEGLLSDREGSTSRGFSEAGTYIMREGDLYLLFNASNSGVGGRGSHGHNDALSIEVSAYGTSFIIDPGTYVYTADLKERHLFRSTAYHSTVEVDSEEQNMIDKTTPFVIGNEAHPKVLRWHTSPERDDVVAEHQGYARLSQPVTHRRTVTFDKRERWWLVKDELSGDGTHMFHFRFHSAPGLEVRASSDANVELCDKITGARLVVATLVEIGPPEIESRFSSREYGAKYPSTSIRWSVRAQVPLVALFGLVAINLGEDLGARLELIRCSAAPAQVNKDLHVGPGLIAFVSLKEAFLNTS